MIEGDGGESSATDIMSAGEEAEQTNGEDLGDILPAVVTEEAEVVDINTVGTVLLLLVAPAFACIALL